METKRFTKNDGSFVCKNCGAEVAPLGYSSRNHCPVCLSSLHVDNLPGDRSQECGGIMDAVSAEPDTKKGGFIITHRCRKCGEYRRNRAATEEAGRSPSGQYDDREKLIALTGKESKR